MPPLPLLGALLDTAGTALKAARGAGSSSAAGNDAATATTAVPFAQTLKQSVTTRRDASNADVPDASTQQASSKPAAGTKPSAADDDDTTDDTTTNAATNPDAAALAAAAAVQAQLQARTDNTVPADAAAAAAAAQKTAVTGQPDATATLADHAARDAAAQTTQATPATSRDALQEALARLTGGSGAIAMPAAGTTVSAPASTAATATAAPLTPKVPTFDRTLADAKGALATQQAPAQATAQALQANANAQS
ncbi:TPA: flagellar hook-length control protein FliK, partial [Burkholderia contaminans]|nr:flagellar hook-length control protein FliK [Burkholderia contaminans]